MILTPARAGLARSAATRAGYPVLEGVKVPLYAISNIARSGATRSNYTSLASYITIDGVPMTHHILRAGAAITDTLDETPTTATFSTFQFHPVEGQDVQFRVGTRNNRARLFAGTILSISRRYVGLPANGIDDCRLIDYTWGLGKRQVRTRYVNRTVAFIVADLVATYTIGYTVGVATDIGAEVVDEITFTESTVPAALTQLTRRVGGSWICDFDKVVRVFWENTTVTPPRPLNAVHPTLMQFASTRDLSQVVTRVHFEGGGVTAFATCAVGETILPLDGAPSWYSPTGGTVVSGPQRLTYTGLSASTGGGMVGPGAGPSGAPVATQTAGTGIESGTHHYAVTFTTAVGESVAGPLATIVVGPVAGPQTAPTVTPYAVGPQPTPGTRSYAVSFLTASGETLPGPLKTRTDAENVLPTPTAAPTGSTSAGSTGPGPDAGSHEYAVSFLTGTGETLPGPIGPPVILSAVPIPNPAPAATVATTPVGMPATGSFAPIGEQQQYVYSYSTAAVYNDYSQQTAPSPPSAVITTISNNDALNPAQSAPVRITFPFSANPSVTRVFIWQKASSVPGGLYRIFWGEPNNPAAGAAGTWHQITTQGGSDSTSPQTAPAANTSGATLPINVGGIMTGPSGTTGRRLYRRSGGVGLRKVTDLTNNSTTTYVDTTLNAALGVVPATANTTYVAVVKVAEIPLGVGGLVTGRKLYRTVAGDVGPFKLLATFFENTTTEFIDNVADASLGANAPTSSTANANRVTLTAIPVGAASVTSRKIYRTAANASQLKLLTTLADNTTTTYLDSASLASLGANVPVADTSGLTQPSGSVAIGATSIQIANMAPFPPSGWAVIGNGQQVIRYTGVSGGTLTGIPATGPGAIVATISYNSTITAAPVLTGIPASGTGSIRVPVLRGDDVNVLITVDDVAAQTALAAMIGGDGIQEHYQQDRRLSIREATSRATAQLELRRDVHVEIQFRTRDLNTRAGATVAVNLGAPFFLIGEFLIQQVTIDFLPTRIATPVFSATASSYRLSFEDLVRAIKAKD